MIKGIISKTKFKQTEIGLISENFGFEDENFVIISTSKTGASFDTFKYQLIIDNIK